MKLFACDFDGTLYRNGAVADADREACQLARKRGHRFGIVTGRGAKTLQRELARFDLPCDFSICNNGALVLDGAGRELGRTELAASLRRRLLRHPAVARASHCALFDGTRMRVLEGKHGYWVNPRYPMPAVSLGEALEDRLQQISLAFPSREEAETEAEVLRRETAGEALVLCSLGRRRRQVQWLEMPPWALGHVGGIGGRHGRRRQRHRHAAGLRRLRHGRVGEGRPGGRPGRCLERGRDSQALSLSAAQTGEEACSGAVSRPCRLRQARPCP